MAHLIYRNIPGTFTLTGSWSLIMDVASIFMHHQSMPEQYQANQHLLNDLIAKMPGHHIYWKSRDGVFLDCNDNQAKTLGLSSRHDVVGKTTYDMIWSEQDELARQEQAELIDATDYQIMCSGETRTVEEPLVLPNGSVAIYLSIKSPLRDIQQNIVGILGVSFDTSDRKRADLLAFQKEKIEQVVDTMKLISASLAHEIRTPLSGALLTSSTISEILPALLETYQQAKNSGLEVPQITNRKLRALSLSCVSLNSQLRSVSMFLELSFQNLDLGSIDKGKFVTFSAASAIELAIDEYPMSKSERNLITLNTISDFTIYGDPRLFSHVIFNLLKNALWFIKSARKGIIEISVDSCSISFKDTSTGIPAETLPYVFDKFYSQRPNGTGVGLAFCKLVIEAFSAKIDCRSTDGEFTEFIIDFPKI